ncbi:MAG: formyl-CoA transferase [Chloroflexi bacterium]|jgi:crotonobetainyl-CoA:carnitine CoA-transferase CaiB-like acyl-CoA transferase|nr:formyl-CoA transferase [Chloroflexota bacterium]MCH2538422.1 CoA transferase [Dehalococcoidia bacterium]MEE2928410.1 CaiB/BaiF CoA-transferase family protein [Chloroflexota bacterium]HIB10755.1 CoA transferase [Dehalococcoidia bacterium]|tara:strand:- start:5228 stop:6415 length:1188 start_codon:yes stop_codon:yes gene_type:complete
MKALDGIRVLDLTRALAGPFCTLMLGDNGADVIKVEIPGSGDDTRKWGPPFIGEESAYYLSINRNKRSLTLNLQDAQAQEVFMKLAQDIDVVVENFTPGVMGRFGLDYDAVKAVNPKVVYCSISGFGQDGPYRNRPAYDQIMQGVGGLMSITGEPDGEPQKIGIAVTDIGAGMWSAFAIMAALNHRGKTGEGQYIDISMLDAQVAWLTYQAAFFFANGEAPKRMGAAHPTLVPYQAFMCKDGKYINVAVGSERIWERFCQGMEREDLKDHPDYATNSVRVNNRGAMVSMLQEIFLTRPVAEWVKDLQAANVPCGPINDLADVFADPQVLARNMYLEMAHPTLGSIKQTGLPIKFSLTPGGLDRHPPLLGEHNQEILKSLGYSEADVQSLMAQSVI